jgi:hypothetical protein
MKPLKPDCRGIGSGADATLAPACKKIAITTTSKAFPFISLLLVGVSMKKLSPPIA